MPGHCTERRGRAHLNTPSCSAENAMALPSALRDKHQTTASAEQVGASEALPAWLRTQRTAARTGPAGTAAAPARTCAAHPAARRPSARAAARACGCADKPGAAVSALCHSVRLPRGRGCARRAARTMSSTCSVTVAPLPFAARAGSPTGMCSITASRAHCCRSCSSARSRNRCARAACSTGQGRVAWRTAGSAELRGRGRQHDATGGARPSWCVRLRG